jgi:hypothetical protein
MSFGPNEVIREYTAVKGKNISNMHYNNYSKIIPQPIVAVCNMDENWKFSLH